MVIIKQLKQVKCVYGTSYDFSNWLDGRHIASCALKCIFSSSYFHNNSLRMFYYIIFNVTAYFEKILYNSFGALCIIKIFWWLV